MNKFFPVREFDFEPEFSDDLFDLLQSCSAEYGDFYAIYSSMQNSQTIVLNEPASIKYVLQTNNRNYTKGPAGIDQVRMLLGEGLMVSEGEFWKKQRRLVQPSFHRETIGNFCEMMSSVNTKMIEELKERATEGSRINVSKMTSEITLEVILRAMFSEDLERINEYSQGNLLYLLAEEHERDLRFAMRFRALGKHIAKLVDERVSDNRWPPDYLTMLAHNTDKTTGLAMTQKSLIDEVLTLIVAGHETTASVLSWAWYLVAQNPEIAGRLRKEAVQVLKFNSLNPEIIFELRFTYMVLQEVMRLYPPGWLLTRRSIDNDTVLGYKIPSGSDIFISPFFLHRNPGIWRNPFEFSPDRFEKAGRGEINKFAYMPFAVGPRKCIGDHFALTEMIIHIALLIQQFDFVLDERVPVEMEAHINLRPRNPIFMKLSKI